jgi:hypothetical protein
LNGANDDGKLKTNRPLNPEASASGCDIRVLAGTRLIPLVNGAQS